MELIKLACLLAGAYLLGGVPFSYLAGRLVRGVDLRTVGSGNLGATNVAREVGWNWGILVFVLDVAKGWLAVALAQWILGPGLPPVLAGLAVILGHSFTPYLGFRGGKGVASSLGVFLRLAPSATGLALAVFVLVLLASRMVSAASLCAALVMPLSLILLGARDTALLIFTCLVSVLIWVRHRSNLMRILRGEEPRITLSREGGN